MDFIAVAEDRRSLGRGSARCSLLGETQRFAVGHSLGETPKLLVELDVAVEPSDRPRALKSLSVGPPARLVVETATAQIFLDPI